MELIKRFAIEVDVEGCQNVYDYGHSTLHTKPQDNQWPLEAICKEASSGLEHFADKNEKARVEKMDAIFNRKQLMEKIFEPHPENGNSVTNSIIVQKQMSRLLPMYKPGDVIHGVLIIELTEPIEGQSLVLKLHGQARTNKRIYHRYGYHDVIGKADYIKEKETIWSKANGESEISDTFAIIGGNNNEPMKSMMIPAGVNRFPFEFHLPKDCPGSTPPLLPNAWHDYAYIAYRLKAKIRFGKMLSRDIIATQGLWIDQQKDIGVYTRNLQPFITETTLDTFKGNGKVTCTVKMPQTAFLRGGPIPASIEIGNMAKEDIYGVIARLDMCGKMRTSTHCMALTRKIHRKGMEIEDGNIIRAGSATVIHINVPINFDQAKVDSNLIPLGTLEDCALIDLQYHFKVIIKRPAFCKNLEVDIPICIGNICSTKIL